MNPIVDRNVVKRLIEELDEKYQRLTAMHRVCEERSQEYAEQRARLTGQMGHLRAILATLDRINDADRLLGRPIPGQAVEDEETMYLGATADDSIRGRGHTAND